MTKDRRYIARTRKHEHRFAVSALIDRDSLQPVTSTVMGWYRNDNLGEVCWRGQCPECPKVVWIVAHPVRGAYSDSRDCDERCTSASGTECLCHCAGRNHGADHAA